MRTPDAESEAEAAMKACDGRDINGRDLRVSIAQHARPPLPARGSGGPPGGGYGGGGGFGK